MSDHSLNPYDNLGHIHGENMSLFILGTSQEESSVLEAGGNRSTRRKPARASMDWKPNAHKALELPGLKPGPQWCKASTEPLR